MLPIHYFQIALFILVLVLLAKPLGIYMAHVYTYSFSADTKAPHRVESLVYRCCHIRYDQEMNWKSYTVSLLLFNLIGLLISYGLQRFQSVLPLNPAQLSAIPPALSFNTAVSFITNTNWQAYSGESTMSYLIQTLVMTVQNFVSAATGMAVAVALIRGIARHETETLGNFWVDLVRGVLYILLPLALILSIILVSQGVIQNYHAYTKVQLLQPTEYTTIANSHSTSLTVHEQTLPMGPVASQVAIKQLGTNGGGFFGSNSAHPFENPTPLSNFFEMLALLLIPAAFCFTFGKMIKDKRQGRALFWIMTLIFIPLLFCATLAEQKGNPLLSRLHVDQQAHMGARSSPGGNMEGKEMRFGIVNSTLWTTATTAASNGSVNSTLDSYTPLGGLVPMFLMQLGEIIYGGVGSGLYGMLLFVMLTVFIAGLMVGRTPEYLGKKIEVFEMKMCCLAILIVPIIVLLFSAIAVATEAGRSSIYNPSAHGFSEVLYAFTSAANNNGSAFTGLNSNTTFYNTMTGLAMLFGRFWIMLAILAIAGSMSRKKIIPPSIGTMPTHTPLFIFLTISIILIIGGLTFLPSLALGPIVEHLIMLGY